MRILKLTAGKFAIVDDEDFDRLAHWAWHYASGYAKRDLPDGIKRTLANEVLKVPQGTLVDHISNAKLDNRKSNLRVASGSQNKANIGLLLSNSTGAKGVSQLRNGKFRAYLNSNRKQKHLGSFPDKITAAKVYDSAAVTQFGEFAVTNKRLGVY